MNNSPDKEAESQERYLALKAVMMPRDTNPHGTIFGGVILSYIDQAGVVAAQREIRRQGWPDQLMVTVAMKSIEFHRPVWVGDIVSFYVRVQAIGRKSITMHVSVETERDGQQMQMTQAEVTYVTVTGQPQDFRPVLIRGSSPPPRPHAGPIQRD